MRWMKSSQEVTVAGVMLFVKKFNSVLLRYFTILSKNTKNCYLNTRK